MPSSVCQKRVLICDSQKPVAETKPALSLGKWLVYNQSCVHLCGDVKSASGHWVQFHEFSCFLEKEKKRKRKAAKDPCLKPLRVAASQCWQYYARWSDSVQGSFFVPWSCLKVVSEGPTEWLKKIAYLSCICQRERMCHSALTKSASPRSSSRLRSDPSTSSERQLKSS